MTLGITTYSIRIFRMATLCIMTLGITTNTIRLFSVTNVSIITLRKMSLSKMSLSKMTLCEMSLSKIASQHNDTHSIKVSAPQFICCSADCRSVECHCSESSGAKNNE